MKQQSTFSVRSSHKFVDPSGKSSYVSNSIENTSAPAKKSGSAPQKGMAVRSSMQAMPDYS